MKIDIDSQAMKWILLKFLKDSIDFLSSELDKEITTEKWAEIWSAMCLTEERIKEWMPENDN